MIINKIIAMQNISINLEKHNLESNFTGTIYYLTEEKTIYFQLLNEKIKKYGNIKPSLNFLLCLERLIISNKNGSIL